MEWRWCFLDVDDGSLEYCSPVMAAGKSRSSLKNLDPCTPPPTKKSRKERNHGKLAANSAASGEVLEREIWKEFPEDLYEAVIARLPIPAFFRFRAVCRKWNSLLESQSFSQHCAEVRRGSPWFYTITHENVNSGAIYDSASKKWHHHPSISSLPSKMIVLPVTSAGGLVCFIDIGHKNFYVCNPLMRSTRELPPRSVRIWSRIAVGMTLNTRSGTYKIVWLGCDGECEVYDSLRNSWARTGSMPSSIKLPLSLNFRSQTVSIGDTLYFMRSDPDGIVSYNTATGSWKQFIIPLPTHLTDHTLAECEGRIILAGLLTKNAATCVCIWELQRMTLLWKEVDRMPNLLCLEFYGKHVRMTCLGNRGLLMLSLRSRQMNRLVTYDVATGEWVKLPGCTVPRGSGRKRQWIACGTAFHPCLTAVP
ncbi:F-box only protein 6 isoform X2 [Punica granatum]|uniref:F-box only protein 6 isoform X2 n=1 Tax=Punica granatum TaxID=22663 RepID=A0A6P8DX17_PUNGR|nr:F-box only protein 6 isoform X2 [Punica granatum]